MLTTLLLMTALAVAPGDISGRADVIDGDTLRIGDVTIRLAGLDAPELRQSCGAVACGEMARDTLQSMIGDQEIACTPTGDRTYGRIVATCRTEMIEDIGAAVVARGSAMNAPRYLPDYASQTAAAAAAGLGMWSGPLEAAWDWRRKGDDAPTDCAIKGNISNAGRIYHMPGSRHYGPTRIDTARGERWFCTENEAVSAGWRAPR